MVEIRVVVPNTRGVYGHVRFAVTFDGPSVSFDGAQKEVRPRSEWESRGVGQIVDAIEVRLKLWIGDHAYTAVEPVRVTSTR